MNRLSKQVILFALGSILFLYMLGLAGRADYNEAVIQEMGNETYTSIRDKLGEGCSDSDIVKEYTENKKDTV